MYMPWSPDCKHLSWSPPSVRSITREPGLVQGPPVLLIAGNCSSWKTPEVMPSMPGPPSAGASTNPIISSPPRETEQPSTAATPSSASKIQTDTVTALLRFF